jgi:dimeric dUTPase (all-alpha-NTP-PPase superfamily)
MIDFVGLAPKQKLLDAHIIKNRGLEEQDLLLSTITALQVEMAELANEVRFFKHWSVNRAPRFEVECHACKGSGEFETVSAWADGRKIESLTGPCACCEGSGVQGKPVLEEFADCLHFYISIGNMLKVRWEAISLMAVPESGHIEIKFALINKYLADCWWEYHDNKKDVGLLWFHALGHFLNLGKLLGFTNEQITAAYLEKNKINYERQANGY